MYKHTVSTVACKRVTPSLTQMNDAPISLNDGNVIIETIDGTQIGAFKSHLAMHSTYFKTTFSQNDHSVLKMEEDVSDWSILLEGMYYGLWCVLCHRSNVV